MNVTYAIVDDDANFLSILTKKILPYTKDNTVLTFSDSSQFLNEIQTNNLSFDIIFLDIDMPDLDGISLAKKIHKINKNVIIIFITNKIDLVYEAFGLNVFRFLSKNNLDSKLDALFKDINTELLSMQTVIIEHNNVIFQVHQNDIIFIEKINRNVYIYTVSETIELKKCNLEKIFSLLKTEIFQYANRSTIINMTYIKLLKNDYLILDNCNKTIYISRDRIKSLQSKFIHLMNE